MGRKCSVFGCKTGFVVRKEVVNKGTTCYRFPKDKTQCGLWIDALPNSNLKLESVLGSVDMAVCA